MKQGLKIGLWALLSLIGFAILLMIAINTQFAQSKLVNSYLKDLAKQTNTSINVSKVKFSLFRSSYCENLTVIDQQQDTIISIPKLKLQLNHFSLKKKELKIRKLTLEHPYIHLKQDSTTAFVFFQKLASSQDTAKSEAKPYKVNIGTINIEQGALRFSPLSKLQTNYFVEDINTQLVLNMLDSTTTHLTVNHFSAKEQRGFEVKKLQTQVIMESDKLLINKLVLKTKYSDIQLPYAKLTFQESPKNPLLFQIKELNSKINLKDLNLISPKIPVYNRSVVLNMSLTLDQELLKIQNMQAQLLNSKLNVVADIRNYQNTKHLKLDCPVFQISSSSQDIQEIKALFSDANKVSSPFLEQEGAIEFNGKLAGGLDSLALMGETKTLAGTLNLNLGVKITPDLLISNFSGNLSSENLSLSSFKTLNLPLDSLQFQVFAKGNLSSPDSATLVRGHIPSMYYNNYHYNNIEIDAIILNQLFIGNLNLNDPNGRFHFKGKVDLNEAKPVFNFEATGENINLHQLKLYQQNPEALLSFHIKTNLSSSSLDNFVGIIDVKDLRYSNKGSTVNLAPLKIKADDYNININSEHIKASLTGAYDLSHLKYGFSNYLAQFIPSVINETPSISQEARNNTFCTYITIKDFNQVLYTLGLDKLLFNQLSYACCYNELTQDFTSKLSVLDLQNNKYSCDTLLFKTSNSESLWDEKTLSSTLTLSGINTKDGADKPVITNFQLTSSTITDSISGSLNWSNKDSITNSGALFFSSKLQQINDQIGISTYLHPSETVIGNMPFNISQGYIYWEKDSLYINNIGMYNDLQSMYVNTYNHSAFSEDIKIELSEFRLDFLCDLLDLKKSVELQGQATGDIFVKNIFKSPWAEGKIDVENLNVNGQHFDKLEVTSVWDTSRLQLDLNALFYLDTVKVLSSTGYFDPLENNILNLDCDLNGLQLNFLDKYLKYSLPNMRGKTNGKINISGPADVLRFNGSVYAYNAHFQIDYLKTHVTFMDSIFFDDSGIHFEGLPIFDSEGNHGVLSGSIYHTAFKDMSYDLSISLQNFLALDTRPKDNKYFYGRAYATGDVHLSGISENLHLGADLRCTGDSRIIIPLEREEEMTKGDFITFYSRYSVDSVKEDKNTFFQPPNKAPLVFTIDMDLSLKENILFEIIFDNTTGEVLEGKGIGNLNLTYDKNKELYFSGEYTIKKGSYNFTFENVLSKKFIIQEGGTLNWSGSPYNAELNIEARYNLKTSLASLSPEFETKLGGSGRISVSPQIFLTERLSKPKVKFGIMLPNAEKIVQNEVNNLIPNDQELSKQVAYLLLFHKFYTPTEVIGKKSTANGSETNQAALVTASEVVSSQLNSWLSGINDDLTVGFVYRPATELNETEVEMSMQTQLLSDRLIINSNFGYRSNSHQANASRANFVGDFDLELKVNKSGSLRLKAYTHSNSDIIIEESPTTQGLGIMYQEDFNSLQELMNKYKRILTRGKKKTPPSQGRESF